MFFKFLVPAQFEAQYPPLLKKYSKWIKSIFMLKSLEKEKETVCNNILTFLKLLYKCGIGCTLLLIYSWGFHGLLRTKTVFFILH